MIVPGPSMKKTVAFLALLLLVVSLSACGGRKAQSGAQAVTTQTIAPAAAKPDTSGTTDPTTQTVDVDDSRSEADGGAASTPTATTAPAKPPGKKKHR